MPLNQKCKIAAISAASALSAIALGTEVIGSIALDTPYAYNAMVVREKFKRFRHEHEKAILKNDVYNYEYEDVLKFFNNPRGAKLIAKPERSDISGKILFYEYNYIPKGEKDKNGKWEENSWSFIKRDKSIKRKKESKWKERGALQDWEAVNMFMKEWEEELKEEDEEQKTI